MAFHFHRVAPYSVLANLLAMPLISLVIMPAGLFGVILLPFGYDVYGWKLMGAGIEGMLKIAQWVSALPGADGRFAAFGAGTILIATAGILLVTIPATRIRLLGIPLLASAFLLAATALRPDILVDAGAKAVAVRASDGRLGILDARSARFVAESWLAADADGRKADDNLASGFRCDRYGCTARLNDGAIVAVARTREALAEDCRKAALVIARFDAPANYAAPAIDLRTLATTGAIGLRRVDGKWLAEPARSPLPSGPGSGARARLTLRPCRGSKVRPLGQWARAQIRAKDGEGATPDEDDAVEE